MGDEDGLGVAFFAGCGAHQPSDLGQARVAEGRGEVLRRPSVALQDDVVPVPPAVLGDVLDTATDLEGDEDQP